MEECTPVHVIDFEGNRQSGVVEYGVATVEGSRITATYTRICAPIGAIAERDRRQHGISEAMAGEEPLFSAEWALFAGLREGGPFCAHNVTVESGLLRAVWPCPRRSPNFAEPGLAEADWGPWLDTLQLYRRIYPRLESYKLEDLIRQFGLQSGLDESAARHCPPRRRRYHCALYDALASALLFLRLREEAALAPASLRWWLMQSAASAEKRQSIEQQELL